MFDSLENCNPRGFPIALTDQFRAPKSSGIGARRMQPETARPVTVPAPALTGPRPSQVAERRCGRLARTQLVPRDGPASATRPLPTSARGSPPEMVGSGAFP